MCSYTHFPSGKVTSTLKAARSLPKTSLEREILMSLLSSEAMNSAMRFLPTMRSGSRGDAEGLYSIHYASSA